MDLLIEIARKEGIQELLGERLATPIQKILTYWSWWSMHYMAGFKIYYQIYGFNFSKCYFNLKSFFPLLKCDSKHLSPYKILTYLIGIDKSFSDKYLILDLLQAHPDFILRQFLPSIWTWFLRDQDRFI